MPNEASAHAPKGLRAAGIVAALVATGIVIAGSITRASEASEARSWSDARAIPTVKLVPVATSDAMASQTLPGTMAAWDAARLYARVGGYVKGWYRDIGAQVATGTALGQIDTPELDQQIAQARADLTRARAHAALSKSTAARWNDLLTTNSVSHQEADEKNGDAAAKAADVQSAEANLGRLMALKQFAMIRAPFAGIVTNRNADIGDLVGPGATAQQPLFAVADVHRIRIYVAVPQAFSGAMTPGLAATLTVPDQPGRTFTAHVIANSGAFNSQTNTLQVQLVADNPGDLLKPGGYAEVRFHLPANASTVQIPSSALLFRAAGTEVALVDGDRIRLQPVRIGRDLGSAVEIVSGLNASQHVVDNPPDSIAAGEQVRIEAKHG